MGKGSERITFVAVEEGFVLHALSNRAVLEMVESFKNSRREIRCLVVILFTRDSVLVVVADMLLSFFLLPPSNRVYPWRNGTICAE